MKPNIHPEYREVAFLDISINKTFIIASSVQTKETVEIDGKTYPLFKLDTSSESHPFYTGAQTRIVEAGRVEKFRAKFAAKNQELTPLPPPRRRSNRFPRGNRRKGIEPLAAFTKRAERRESESFAGRLPVFLWGLCAPSSAAFL